MSELLLGGAFGLQLELKVPEVCPYPQRAHIQFWFWFFLWVWEVFLEGMYIQPETVAILGN